MVDLVATIAKKLEDVNDVKDKSLFEITAFWAPLLLLHLVGLDTCLEDNKFWLRHLLGLGFQTGAVLSIWITTLTISPTLHSINSDVF